jgi:hypothetical protein
VSEKKNWGASWADEHIAALKRGETVSFRPHGRSMEPRIMSGQLCTVEPVDPLTLGTDDVVLCRVGRKQYLHIVHAIQPIVVTAGVRHFRSSTPFMIGNNKGGLNGWIGPEDVYGRLVKVTS